MNRDIAILLYFWNKKMMTWQVDIKHPIYHVYQYIFIQMFQVAMESQ